MKNLIISSIMVALLAAGSVLKAQNRQEEYLGLPGDNLNLYAVMQLFQDSKTLEEFERELNDRDRNINNLDLNGDNYVDYIKVFDNVDGSIHNIVLQVAVGPRDNQDVAVFTVVRFNNGQVQIQLTGDEALYGRNYIIEPIADETPNPGYNGVYVRTTPAQIAVWPVIRYIYLPSYTVWHSRWYWGYYPTYWDPWYAHSWHYYYGYHSHWNDYYYSRYHHYDKHRHTAWNDYYYHGRRTYSPEVSQRISKGVYKTTYSRPEQRRDGEQLFAKKHPEEYRKSSSKSSVNNFSNSRRSDNSKDVTTRVNSTVSRSVNKGTKSENTVNRSSSEKVNNGSSRRSSESDNSVNRSSSEKVNSGSSRRSSETVNRSVNSDQSGSKTNNFKNYRRGESGEARKSDNSNGSQKSVNSQSSPSRQKSSGSEGQKTRSSGSTSKTKSESSSGNNSKKENTESKSERRRQ